MRHSIWKLTALVGISGLGFLALLQVQKSLHSTVTAEAAEMSAGDPTPPPSANGNSKAAPGRVRLSDVPSAVSTRQRQVATVKVESDGLDFREKLPQHAASEKAATPLERTAEVKLKQVPQGLNEQKPIISPASFEASTTSKSALVEKSPVQTQGEAQPLAEDLQPVPQEEPELLAVEDEFGPDPFAELEPLAPMEEAAKLAEPATTDSPASPAELLEQDDPFATLPEKMPAVEPTPSNPLVPATDSESSPAELSDEEPVVPAGDPVEAEPAFDAAIPEMEQPTATEQDSDELAPEPTLEPSPSEEPLPPPQNPENAVEPKSTDEPLEPQPAQDPFDFDFGDPSDDPFGGEPMADPATSEPEPTPEPEVTPDSELIPEPETAEPRAEPPIATSPADSQPEPELEPAPSERELAPMPFDPSTSPSESDSLENAAPQVTPELEDEPAPAADPFGGETGSDQRPGLLPSDDSSAEDGFDTVNPDAPRGPQHARLTVEKKAPARAVLGEPLVYEIIVTNVGESPAHEVTISDVVPRGAELQGTIPRAEMTGRTLVWKYESLKPQQSQTIKIKVTPTEAGSIGSVATVNFVSEVAASTEVVAPRLSLKVTAPPRVSLGEPVDLRFEIANQGSAPAEKVLLRNILPDGFQHADGRDLEYEVGTLAPGAIENVVLRVATTKPGDFENAATLTAAGGLQTEATASVEVEAQPLSVTRQGPRRRYVGRPAMFANVVKNSSNDVARNVKVFEQVPPGMDFVEASHDGKFDPTTRNVVWQLDAIQPAQEIALQIVLTATTEGDQESLVRVEEAGRNPIELTSSTTVQGLPSLAPTMQGAEKPIIVGERTAFRIRVKNRGNAPAEGVEVTLTLPPQAKFLEATGGEAATDATGVTTVKVLAPIQPGEEKVVEMIVEGASAGTARLRTSVSASHMAEPLVRDEELIVLAPKS